MSTRNVQKRENQEIRRIFEQAGDLRKVLLGGIDYAKSDHRIALCNGQGDLLDDLLYVRNSAAGLSFLQERVEALATRHGIEPAHIIFGGETPGSWAENFACSLQQAGYLVIDLYAKRVEKFKENESRSDSLSAQVICRCLMNKMGRTRTDDSPYGLLKGLTRARRRLVFKRTRVSNQLHSFCDIYFPGFLHADSPLRPFGPASFAVLRKYSLAKLRRCRPHTLTKLLKKHRIRDAAKVCEQLKQLAGQALDPTPSQCQHCAMEIPMLIDQYELLNDQIDEAVDAIALALRQTPGCLLTLVTGIGIVSAATLTAEIGGTPVDWDADSKACYFALTDRIHQTGGPDQAPISLGPPRNYNRVGKDALLRTSDSLVRHGPEEFKRYYHEREKNAQNARYGLARKVLRYSISVLAQPHEYHPPVLRQLDDPHHPLWEPHFAQLQERIQTIWKAHPCDLPPAQDYLKQWQQTVEACHGITIRI